MFLRPIPGRGNGLPFVPAQSLSKPAAIGRPVVHMTSRKEREPVCEETEVATKGKKNTGKQLPAKLNSHDTTLNCLLDQEGKTLSSLQSDGFHLLQAQARGNFGAKKGRHYFEIEFLDCAEYPDFRIGVSTSTAKWVGGQDSISFDGALTVRINGEDQEKEKKEKEQEILYVHKSEIVGCLLNLDSKDKNKNTVSFFISGVRASEPIPLPKNLLGKTLFPHVGCMSAVMHISMGPNMLKALSFQPKTWAEANKTDMEESKVKATESPEAVISVGFQEGWAEKYLAESKKSNWAELTVAHLKEWASESEIVPQTWAQRGVDETKYNVMCLDQPFLFLHWARVKQRNVLMDADHANFFFETSRAHFAKLLPHHEKKAVIVPFEAKEARIHQRNNIAALPTEEEKDYAISYASGFNAAKAAEQFKAWQQDQTLRTRIEGFSVGASFAKKFKTWSKFVAEKKATEEGKNFSEEDWMLADMNAEVHYLLQSFKYDSADELRTSFPPALLAHYYRIYMKNKQYNPNFYGCKSTEELFEEYFPETLKVDDRGLLTTKLPVEELKPEDLVEEKKEEDAKMEDKEEEEKKEEVKEEKEVKEEEKKEEVKEEEKEEKKEEVKEEEKKEEAVKEPEPEVVDEFAEKVNARIFEIINHQRKVRLLRVGAGDEESELKFTARIAKNSVNNSYGGKGKGYKGGKRPGGFIPGPPGQMRRIY